MVAIAGGTYDGGLTTRSGTGNGCDGMIESCAIHFATEIDDHRNPRHYDCNEINRVTALHSAAVYLTLKHYIIASSHTQIDQIIAYMQPNPQKQFSSFGVLLVYPIFRWPTSFRFNKSQDEFVLHFFPVFELMTCAILWFDRLVACMLGSDKRAKWQGKLQRLSAILFAGPVHMMS